MLWIDTVELLLKQVLTGPKKVSLYVCRWDYAKYCPLVETNQMAIFLKHDHGV